ncbi:MAG TPA: hypothetical protein VL576_00015 [Candidatus Paceibacterota bacterium]|jgi:hypothetical protein|nr:hypothetical protein [Candidatus Paceibacterota bacterium]
MELLHLDNHQKISDYLNGVSLANTFFASPIMLNTFLNKPGFCVYGVQDKSEKYIFIQKEGTKELRFLFKEFPDEVVEFLKKEFNPPYIAYNELVINPEKENQNIEEDAFVFIEKTLEFNDGSIRRKYNSALKNNTALVVKDFSEEDKKNLKAFWETWSTQKSERSETFIRHTDHDERFFELYTDKDFYGKCFYDGEVLVAYTILVPLHGNVCLGAFNKCLRGYTQLGLEVFVERLKIAQKLGYEKISIAGAINLFKKQFKDIEYMPVYCYELCRDESFKTKNANGYSTVLLR